jgi:regulation of enolase protein 1 (concanavalin A-like superfamily)
MRCVFRIRSLLIAAAMLTLTAGFARPAAAQTLAPQERLCDPSFEDCRADILTYIQQETVGIDVAFWMMSDARYSNALVAAWQRGVRVRVLMDPRCVAAHPQCQPAMDQLRAAGIPMRNRITSGILHWKMFLFASQGQVEFSGANQVPFEFVPEIPYVNYTDEVIYYTNQASVVNSFMTKFDDLWTSTTEFGDYGNITPPLVRSYPVSPIDPDLNFPPDDSYRERSTAAYVAETQKIDVFMFRITDLQQTNAILYTLSRGVPVRLITDETEYRNPSRLWDAYNVDIMYHAGVQVKLDAHQGIDHEKAVMLYGQRMSIFGSSNWTSPSSDSQREHNYFTTKSWIFDWLDAQFNRKWNNSAGYTETKPFVPLPPDQPAYATPANGATNQPTTGVVLRWDAGLWAHLYDIYFGTSPNPPLIETNKPLGPSQYTGDYRQYALPDLQPGTTYYWKIVSKTMAYMTDEGPVWSFSTAGPPNNPPSVSLTSPANGATFTTPASIAFAASAGDTDGTIASVKFFAGSTLVGTATAAPYTATWNNVAAGTYTLTAVATDNGGATATSAAVSVTVTGSSNGLPPPWLHGDVGAVGIAGDATYANPTFTVTGAGADVWGTADAFHYVYTTLAGGGSIVARVASVQNTASWAKAGVMIRNSLDPGSAQAFMLVSWAKGVAFQRRTADGGTSVSTPGTLSTAPRWVKLTRSGATISAFESADGVAWTQVGTDSFPSMGATVFVGLAVSSHVSGVNCTATFDGVTVAPANTPPAAALTAPASGATYIAPATVTLTASATDSDGSIAKVDFYAGATLLGTATASPWTITWSNVAAGTYNLTAVATDNAGATGTSAAVSITVTDASPPGGLPAGWNDQDIGAVTSAGSATYDAPTFTITGQGADIWNTADAFHYAYRTLSGDGTIVARVASVQYADRWSKAGVMIRETLNAGSAHAFMLVSAGKGVAFQRRDATNDVTVSTAGSLSAPPRWVKLTRSGNTFSAYESADGAAWTLAGTDTIPMSVNVLIGLAVTSHATASSTATLDSITIQ